MTEQATNEARRAEDPIRLSRAASVLLTVVVLVIIASFCAVVAPNLTLTEYAQGIITFMLGKYSGLFEQAFQREFGTSASSAKKDATISRLTSTAGTIAQTAAVVASAQNASEPVPVKIMEGAGTAGGEPLNVQEQPKP